MSEEDREVEVAKGGCLPCSGSWFCGGVIAKGVGDEEGEVEYVEGEEAGRGRVR